MKLTIPTWLMFVFLGIASFAPMVSVRSGWWVLAYYGALLVWWLLVLIAGLREAARETQTAKRQLARALRQLQDVSNTDATETAVEAARHALAARQLIVVARDEIVLYDHIRRDAPGGEAGRVIRDRRGSDRRLRTDQHVPDRRRGERRRHDIGPVLVARGWAQVPLLEH